MMILQYHVQTSLHAQDSSSTKTGQDRLYIAVDFQASGVLLQTECILLNHWFVYILGVLVYNRFLRWLQSLILSHIKIEFIFMLQFISNLKQQIVNHLIKLALMSQNNLWRMQCMKAYIGRKTRFTTSSISCQYLFLDKLDFASNNKLFPTFLYLRYHEVPSQSISSWESPHP